VRYSISVPNFGELADPRLHTEIAREAERAGWDGYFVWDHLLVWNGNVVADPWSILTAVALGTERIRLGPMLVPLPRRRPWQVVRQIVTLDRLSGGRAILGAGLGFPPHEEFEVFGEPSDAKARAAILDEGLEVVAGLMTGEPFSFAGEHVTIDDVTFAPVPVQRPRVPIWIGGAWPRRAPFRRAARWDGVVPILLDDGGEQIEVTVEAQRAVVAYTLEHRAGDGPFDVVFTGPLPDDDAQALERADELASFGVTWWQTSVDHPEQSLAHLRERILAGPPGRG
jgi:alkanesulfonate monooxygenase SsuD/methylene tetrahydromethanopterin reductase-like flavin-dependent oxidoreductase (luciferase family)